MPEIEIEEVQAQAQEQVDEYNTDFMRDHLIERMDLKITPPTDEVLMKEFDARMTRLEYLENHLEEMALQLNCSKDEVLAEVVSSNTMLHRAEQAEKQLEAERTNYARALMDFRNDVTRATECAQNALAQCEKLTDELMKIEAENSRLSWWERLFTKGEKGGSEEQTESEE